MKKELIKTFRIYTSDKLELITIQLEGHGYKTIFISEEEALDGLKCNIDSKYKTGSFIILPVYDVRYVD